MRSIFFLLTVAVCTVFVHFISNAKEDDPDPSIVEFHMSGTADGVACMLTSYIYIGGQNASPVDLKAFKIERTSAGGETQSFSLAPELQAGNKQNANERTFTWIDTTAKTGDTYRYIGTYEADVFLSTCPVVLTKPLIASAATTHGIQDPFQVEVQGDTVCMGNHVLLFRARATDPKASLNWSPVQPCMGLLLAQHNGTAMIRAPAEVGAGHAYFKVEAKAGGKTAETYICPNVVSMSFVPVEEYDRTEINEVASKSEKGKEILHARLEKVYGKGGSTAERFMLRNYLEQVGNVAEIVHEYMDKMDDRNAKYAVFSLIASQWPSYARKYFLAEALASGDLPRISALLSGIGRNKGEDTAEALKALQLCAVDRVPTVRLMAVSALGDSKNKEDVLPLLNEILRNDSNSALRFAAASAINQLTMGKRPEIPPLPQYGSVTSSRADRALARKLYLKVLADLGKPIQEDAFDDKPDFYVSLNGEGLGGIINEDRPAGLDAVVRPGSNLAQLCVLGDAVLPILRKRFLSAHATFQERELLKWVLEKNHIQFPADVEAQVVEAFFKAKPEERAAALEFYRNLGVEYPTLIESSFAVFANGKFEKATSLERLRWLAEADGWMRTIFRQTEEEARALLAGVRLNAKPNFAANAVQEKMVWVWRWLQEQDGAIGEHARQWPRLAK
jgi:hypothetical protein